MTAHRRIASVIVLACALGAAPSLLSSARASAEPSTEVAAAPSSSATTAPSTAAPSTAAPSTAAPSTAAALNATPSAPAEARGTTYTLDQCLVLADERSPQLRMAADKVAEAQAQLDEVIWLPWSQFNMNLWGGVVPAFTGSALYSPSRDVSISDRMGPAFRVSIEGLAPIYTFGKIDASRTAARKMVEIAAADADRFRALLHHDVRRAFFSLQLARDGRYLLDQAKGKLEEAVARLEANPDSDEADLLRMKSYALEVQARAGELEKNERIAKTTLRILTKIDEPAPFDIPDDPLWQPRHALVDPLVYLRAARLHRPELRQVVAGLVARKAQVDLARARLFPDLGAAFFLNYAVAPQVTDQVNPFVVDNYNYLRYGFGFVFRWNMDLLSGAARVRYAEAQLQEMRNTEAFALGGIGVEVETAFATAKDAVTREKAYGEAEKIAKRWVASVSSGIAVGTKEDKDLVEPLKAYMTNRFSHLQALMDLDVALSSLSLATGDDSFAVYQAGPS